MSVKNKIKIFIDALMLCDFIILMCHETIRNLQFHGYCGIALFCLFVIHHILNFSFYKSAFKGKYNFTRALFSVTSWLLFLLMISMAVSSVLMSGFVFDFINISGSLFARKFHNFSCGWGFLIMGFHLGLHVHGPLEQLEIFCLKKNIVIYSVLETVILLTAISSVICFFVSDIGFYLFLGDGWKRSAPNFAVCLLENLGMLAGMILLGHMFRLHPVKARK